MIKRAVDNMTLPYIWNMYVAVVLTSIMDG